MNQPTSKVDAVLAEAQRRRESSYREKALKMYPWICGRCGREFSGVRLRELTVHHRDHNHDNNPEDGSNWELLCLYCHDNEHQRQVDLHYQNSNDTGRTGPKVTHKGLAGLAELLKKKEDGQA
ncbi:YajD family HNH nuclease [Pseudomonas sp. ZM23]|uniref:Putative HNH nuclease YajD n=1 Tax=Pseudomonas triclosanedens TaxID=2961893 RepID=A0ABY7A7F3_9PSED|nr:YajD family HNH nuclease [Pseudomonas triclosanedens]MCP8465564.1 YajD family HNH nuclease [Pseudomonas triclosanedens]MCP8471059.1 YajD family HNH nuclease [Pseudomonas triclosanedens]MCP8476863.1 YajD family HNH nuclease [Pseudomonas triclosanedens]WAI52023.1 YajD family HNH nuclease [Pseudomonas triclosanedens]